MRKLTKMLVIALFVAFGATQIQAQDLTDQDYKDYAIILMAQEAITDKISPMVNDLIEKQEGMTGQRFQELRNKSGEPAQEWETQFMNLVNGQIKKKQDAAKTVLNTLAKHSLGVKKYNAVKKAYAQGGTAKAKVDAFKASVE